MCDAASGLLPDFAGRGAVVRLPIGRITVLIGIKIFFWVGRNNFMNPANRAIGSFIAGRNDQLRAERTEDALALRRRAVRKAQLDRIAERGADHRISDAGVAARGVDEDLAAAKLAAGKTRLDHAEH